MLQDPLESHKTTGDISSGIFSFLSLRHKGLIAEASLESTPITRSLLIRRISLIQKGHIENVRQGFRPNA